MKLMKHDTGGAIEMDMTPMIDVVFQLIIFFILITDMTQSDLEELKLPVARNAVEDKPQPGVVRPVINIRSDGTMVTKRKVVFEPEADDATTLERFLADQARLMPQKLDPELELELPDNPLLIRADRNTEFKYLQRIMEICGKKGIQIWKLQLAAAEEPAKVAARKTED